VNRHLAALFSFYDYHARNGVALAKVLVEWRRSNRGGYRPFLHHVSAGRPVPTRPEDPLFPTNRRGPLSRDAVEHLLAKYSAAAAKTCPSLRDKKLAPHALRHTCAVELRRAGVDQATLALWLGHESVRTTDIYNHADLSIKEKALARTRPRKVARGRYKPSDSLLAFLEGL
jgi:integrase